MIFGHPGHKEVEFDTFRFLSHARGALDPISTARLTTGLAHGLHRDAAIHKL
jgi:hypothetical protein